MKLGLRFLALGIFTVARITIFAHGTDFIAQIDNMDQKFDDEMNTLFWSGKSLRHLVDLCKTEYAEKYKNNKLTDREIARIYDRLIFKYQEFHEIYEAFPQSIDRYSQNLRDLVNVEKRKNKNIILSMKSINALMELKDKINTKVNPQIEQLLFNSQSLLTEANHIGYIWRCYAIQITLMRLEIKTNRSYTFIRKHMKRFAMFIYSTISDPLRYWFGEAKLRSNWRKRLNRKYDHISEKWYFNDKIKILDPDHNHIIKALKFCRSGIDLINTFNNNHPNELDKVLVEKLNESHKRIRNMSKFIQNVDYEISSMLGIVISFKASQDTTKHYNNLADKYFNQIPHYGAHKVRSVEVNSLFSIKYIIIGTIILIIIIATVIYGLLISMGWRKRKVIFI